MRIFIGGLQHETNSFNPKPTFVEDFTIIRGKELLDDPGVHPFLDENIDIVPGLYADAIPSGPVDLETYTYFKNSLLRTIEEQGPFDGICLFLHGAMVVKSIGDGENDLLRNVREVVGQQTLISVSLDLHGNISPELARYADICTAYRTAPHVDMGETRKRAVELLIRSIRSNLRPSTVIVKIPIMLAGDPAVTSVKPASELYARLPEIDQVDGILTSSIMIGYSWNDTPSIGSSVIVTAEGREYKKQATAAALSLAAEFWNRRTDFQFAVPTGTIDEMIQMAMNCTESPAFISDSGDNVTSGAAGDVPLFLERLLNAGATDVVLSAIIDADAVAVCRAAGIGSRVTTELGGKLDTVNGQPLTVVGTVRTITLHGVVLRVEGVDVIITSTRLSFTTIADFAAFGIDPKLCGIVVVKLGYLFPELAAIAARSFFAFSPGFASQNLKLPYEHIPRPIYPLDPDMEWSHNEE